MFTINEIAHKLRDYRRMTTIQKQLTFELQAVDQIVTDEYIISTLALPQPFSDSVGNGGKIADRTADAAVQYKEAAEHMRGQYKAELHKQLIPIELELKRIDYYISLLEPQLTEVVSSLYIEGCSVEQAAESLGLMPKTLRSRRKQGLEALTEMYNRLPTSQF